MELNGSRSIVTGGGSGFGLAIAMRLLENNVKVAVLDCDELKLNDLESKYPQLLALQCDVSDYEQVDLCVDRVFDEFKGLEILVNNAGIMKNAPLINIIDRNDRRHSIDLWRKVMSVNLDSVFYVTRSVVNKMIDNRNKGVIVNISSISAQGNAGQTAYSASKAAVESMTKVWSKELGRMGIRSVAIAPGFMDTAGTKEALEKKMLKRWIEQTPLRRTGNIKEVVSTVLYAIENDFINGTVLSLNGGLVI